MNAAAIGVHSEAKTSFAEGNQSPWRFLEALDAKNPADIELLQRTRGNELEIIRNLVLSSRVTLLYAFSGNGKSSLINAGIIPSFHRSGFAVFRTRPRPALSLTSPSQAFKDCILQESWIPAKLRGDNETMFVTARAALSELTPSLQRIFEPVILRAIPLLQQVTTSDDFPSEFRRHLIEQRELPLPQFVKEIQKKLGTEVPILIILDQFEELFVHYYNTPQMDRFVEELGTIYAAKDLRVRLLFSMREDWVGSMVKFRNAIPDIFTSCFKIDPIRVSQAAPALVDPPSRFGVTLDQELPDRILKDLSSFYSVLQKQSFTAVHLSPSGDDAKDPYIELPALQVLMERLWRSVDFSKSSIGLDSYLKLAPGGNSNPAEYALQRYLDDYLDEVGSNEGQDRAFNRLLRIDLLYLLTDRFAHRRAVSDGAVLSEANQIRAGTPDGQPPLTSEHVQRALAPLVESKIIRCEDGSGGWGRYELAHDFLVRSVVKLWNSLDKQRTAQQARFAERQEQSRRRLLILQGIEKSVVPLIFVLAGVSLAAIGAAAYYWTSPQEYPATAIFLLGPVGMLGAGLAVRSKPSVFFALAVVAGFLGIRSMLPRFWWPVTLFDSNATAFSLTYLGMISLFLFPGLVSWAYRIRGGSESKQLAWAILAGNGFNYAYFMAIPMIAGLLWDWKLNTAGFPILGVFWLCSQLGAAGDRSTIGHLTYGLIFRSKSNRKGRPSLRAVLGQLAVPIVPLTCWFGFSISQFTTLTAIVLASIITFLLVRIIVVLRSADYQSLLDRVFGVEMVKRAQAEPDSFSINES